MGGQPAHSITAIARQQNKHSLASPGRPPLLRTWELSRVAGLDSVQSSAQEIIMKPSLVIYHSAVTIISQEILFHAQYTSLQWWQWYNISRTEGIKLELLLLEVTAISVIKSLKSHGKTRIRSGSGNIAFYFNFHVRCDHWNISLIFEVKSKSWQ